MSKLAASCPDPNAVANFGFCIWPYNAYDKTYFQAATLCKTQGGRLCSRAEISAAQAAGAEWCSNNWIADRVDSMTAYTCYPRQTPSVNCGGLVGLVEGPVDTMALRGANCCRP